MTSTPWSVKGIDSKARETAKELARRSGMTLGEWLNERIREEGGTLVEESASSVTRALHELTGRIETAEQRSTLTLAGVDQTVKGVLARLELTEREAVAVGARFEGALQEQQTLQAAIDARLRKLESEAAGPRSAEALKSLEAALGRVANHLYEGEGRTRDSITELRRDMGNLTARLERAEAKGQSGVEGDVAALVQRLDKAEARAAERLRALEESFSKLNKRLTAAEGRLDDPAPSAEVEKKLEDMAANLARGLQAARAEMTRQLKQAIDGGQDRMDEALLEMSAHVQAAEKRSAEALEKMGQEVLRVADVLNRRVQGVETRTAGAISNMGAEVARVVDTLDSRIDRADAAQAETIEKIGEEITRVTERLSDRIGVAERRAAQAVDDVQDKLALAAERLNQRHDRSQGDLAERIRLSEERTQRLLEEARERIERRMADVAKVAAPVISAPPVPPTVSAGPYAEPASFAADSLQAPAFPSAHPEASGAASRAIYPDAAPFGVTYAPHANRAAGFTPVEPEFDEEDIEAAQDFPAPLKAETEADFVEEEFRAEDLDDEPLLASPAQDEPADDALIAEVEEAPPVMAQAAAPRPVQDDALLEPAAETAKAPAPSIAPRILTTKELVEQARAAARAASDEQKSKKAKPKKSESASGESSVIGPIGFNTRKRKDSGAHPAMYMALTGAVLMLGAGSYALFGTEAGEEIVNAWKGGKPGDEVTPRAAVALDPKPIVDAPPAPVVTGAAVDPAASGLYESAIAKLKAKDNSGVEMLTRAANLGHPRAQFDLAELYEDGGAGLTQSLVEARRWYERAAKGGDPQAMHNTALMHYDGKGGPKNVVSAAEWFKRAAEAGLADSQYNIAQIYEFPHPGVTQNAAEAYKWYLLAAKGGSESQKAQARAAADRVKVTLPASARSAAERIASDFIAHSSGAPVPISTGSLSLVEAQTALARLDYYRGPIDGKASQALRTAIQDFQRDRGMDQNGELDSVTALKLRPFVLK